MLLPNEYLDIYFLIYTAAGLLITVLVNTFLGVPSSDHTIGAVVGLLIFKIFTAQSRMGESLAWSYYLGYLRAGFEKLNSDSRSQERSETLNIAGFFILIPDNGEVAATVTDVDKTIRFSGYKAERVENVAGTVGRTYKHTVYCVPDHEDEEGFNAIIEYPPALSVLTKLLNSNSPYKLSFAADLNREVASFHKELERILANYYTKTVREDQLAIEEQHQEFSQLVHLVKVPEGETDIAKLIRNARRQTLWKNIQIIVKT